MSFSLLTLEKRKKKARSFFVRIAPFSDDSGGFLRLIFFKMDATESWLALKSKSGDELLAECAFFFLDSRVIFSTIENKGREKKTLGLSKQLNLSLSSSEKQSSARSSASTGCLRRGRPRLFLILLLLLLLPKRKEWKQQRRRQRRRRRRRRRRQRQRRRRQKSRRRLLQAPPPPRRPRPGSARGRSAR